MIKKLCYSLIIVAVFSRVDAEQSLTVSFEKTNSWENGYQGNVNIKNLSNKPITWEVSFNIAEQQRINLWNAESKIEGTQVQVTPPHWEKELHPDRSAQFGFVVTGPGFTEPQNLTIKDISSSEEPARTIENKSSYITEPITRPIQIPEQSTSCSIPEQSTSSSKKLVGYFPNWFLYEKKNIQSFEASKIEANYLTHINYAFVKPYTTDSSGNVISYKVSLTDPWADTDHGPISQDLNVGGHIGQLYELKKRYPHLKTLVSVGGWTIWREGFPAAKFSTLAADANLRKEFIDSLIALAEQYKFDGIDLDWEYPGHVGNGGKPEDKENFTILIEELSAAAKSKNLLLTIAAPAGPSNIANMEIEKIIPYLDWINLMSYDFHGPWGGSDNEVTNHNAPLYATLHGNHEFNVDSAVDTYLKLGVPREKLVVGLPLYGRTYSGVESTTDGLYSPYTGPGPGMDENEPGMLLYYHIMNEYLPNYSKGWDDRAKVPYLFNKNSKVFITYDDARSLEEKANYIKEKDLGGAMLWSLANNPKQWEIIEQIQHNLT